MMILFRTTVTLLLTILAVAGLMPSPVAAQTPFAFSYGSQNLTTRGAANVVDAEGNYINGGNFTTAISPDPLGDTTLESIGDAFDIVIAKYSSAGAFLWSKRIGSPHQSDLLIDLGCDSAGNIYATGRFRSAIDFDGEKIFSQGGDDAFLVKYAPDGTYLWAITLGTVGRNRNESYGSLAIDAEGNAYISGVFTGTVDLNPLGEPALRGSADTTRASGFLAKYDGDGILQWASVITGAPSFASLGRLHYPVIDGNALYLVATVEGSNVDINPLGDPVILSGSGPVGYHLVEYAANTGTLRAVRPIGAATGLTVYSMAFDGASTLAISGAMHDSVAVDFDPMGDGGLVDSSTVYFATYSTDGAFRNAFGLHGHIHLNGPVFDSRGDLYLSGWLGGGRPTDIDPDPSRTEIRKRSVSGGTNAFIAKYDRDGRLLWDYNFGGIIGNAQVAIADLAVDRNDDVYTTGWISGSSVDVDPGPETQMITGTTIETNTDLFIVKYTAGGALWRSGTTGVAEDRSDGAMLRLLLR